MIHDIAGFLDFVKQKLTHIIHTVPYNTELSRVTINLISNIQGDSKNTWLKMK